MSSLGTTRRVGLSDASPVSQTLGKYTLVRKLATGGMAEVFLARAEGPGGFAKKCVVKRILPHFNDDPRFIEMFLGEARLAAELNHPNLVQIFDFGQDHGQYFLAMEYIDGPNLRVLNRSARAEFGPLAFPLAARIICLAAEGLHYAHELRNEQGEFLNLVHRDISPDNILVSRNGAVKVVDFGIAKATTQPHLTKSGMIKGKMAYMPPEQLAREPLDRRADLFALGIVLYELITGGMPFDATSEVSIIQALMSVKPLERATVFRPDCPPALEAIVMRCLEKDRERRYPSCVELQADLEAFIGASGQNVTTRDVAQLVETVFKNEAVVTAPETRIPDGLEATSPSGVSQPRDAAPVPSVRPVPQTGGGSGLSSTKLRSIETHAVQRSRAPLVALASAVVVSVAAGAWFATRPPDPPIAPPQPRPPPVVALVDAGPAAPEPVDAGAPAEEPDAGAPVEPIDAGPATAPVRPQAVRYGKLELRIRPYATVYLDEKKLGDTPLPPVTVPVGKHTLRLVNPTLGKDVQLQLVIKPGENVVKHNLKE